MEPKCLGLARVFVRVPTARLLERCLLFKPSGGEAKKMSCLWFAAARSFACWRGYARYDTAASVHTCVRLIKQFIMRFCTMRTVIHLTARSCKTFTQH
jgi:hypothetical protein